MASSPSMTQWQATETSATRSVPPPVATTLSAVAHFQSPISQAAAMVHAATDAAVEAYRTSAKRNLDRRGSDRPGSSPPMLAPGAAAAGPAGATAAAAVASPAATSAAPGPAPAASALSPTFQAAAAATRAATAALQASTRPTKAWDKPQRGRGRGCQKRRSSAVAIGSSSRRRHQRAVTDSVRAASRTLVVPPPATPSTGPAAGAMWHESLQLHAARPLARYRPPARTGGGPGALRPTSRLGLAQALEEANSYREIRYRRSPS